MPRLLLLLPTTTYRAEDFLEAARTLGVEVTVASEEASSVAGANPAGLIRLNFRDPEMAAQAAVEFSREHPIDAVIGVDDASVLPAAGIARALGLPHNPVEAVADARNKWESRQRLREAGLRTPWCCLCSRDLDPEFISRDID